MLDRLFRTGLAATSFSPENLWILLQTTKENTNITLVVIMIICLVSVQLLKGSKFLMKNDFFMLEHLF